MMKPIYVSTELTYLSTFLSSLFFSPSPSPSPSPSRTLSNPYLASHIPQQPSSFPSFFNNTASISVKCESRLSRRGEVYEVVDRYFCPCNFVTFVPLYHLEM